jgi:hypothetical protein
VGRTEREIQVQVRQHGTFDGAIVEGSRLGRNRRAEVSLLSGKLDVQVVKKFVETIDLQQSEVAA